MIQRAETLGAIRSALRRAPIVAVVGPRQSGKTTLARTLLRPDSPAYFDLEDPADLARLAEPMTELRTLRGVVVIDEVQRRPDLFPVLRVLADRPRTPARFLVLGSASPTLLRQSSESLAGRIETIPVGGFVLSETGAGAIDRLWSRGGFPRSFLARSDADSVRWRREFVSTYLERDVPALGISVPATTLLRFWTMLAHWHGQTWNASEFARAMGVSEPAVRRYLNLLSDLFLVRQLQPWHENLAKRQVKSPKLYVRDSGLLHVLLGIATARGLAAHPKVGASWEGWVLEQVLEATKPDHAYFWSTHQGAELDLLLFLGGRRVGVEIKRSDAPVATASMRIALADLRLNRLIVVYPGEKRYSLGAGIEVEPAATLADPAAWRRLLARRSRMPPA
jgi:predicted AAA+ superfamily ATPase